MDFDRETVFDEEFGRLVAKGIHSVAFERGKKIGDTKEDVAEELGCHVATVERRMRGHIPPDIAEIETLTIYCLEKGRLDQDWARRVLKKAGHPNPEGFLLGRLVKKGIQKVASRQNRETTEVIKAVESKLGYRNGEVDKLLKGYIPTQPEQIEMLVLELVNYCVVKGKLDREWAWGVLKLARYPNPERVLSDLFETDTDGVSRPKTTTSSPPSPEFNDDILELETPGGAVKLDDRLYIRREADAQLAREIIKRGTTTTIRAPRQTGKTSLLIRGLLDARRCDFKEIHLDLQGVNQEVLTSIDSFYQYLTYYVSKKLKLDTYHRIDEIWQSPGTPNDKLTEFIENYVLPVSDNPILFAIDEADRLLYEDFSEDFFGLLRSWHNRRAMDDRWNTFNIVLVISTEPSLLIRDVRQSPFNVGLKLALEDFSQEQVRELNIRHNSPLNETQISDMMFLLGGHPYLTRLAFYVLVTKKLTWDQFQSVHIVELESINEHLRHHYDLLQKEPELKETLKQIIAHGHCEDQQSFSRLLRAGLVKGSQNKCRCRCQLYRQYFEEKL